MSSNAAKQAAHWGYSQADPLGPERWAELYPGGQRQSPIDIQLDWRQLRHLACAGCGLSERMQRQLKCPAGRQQVAPAGRRHLDSQGEPDERDDELDDELELGPRSASASSSASPTHQSDTSDLSSGSSSGAGSPPAKQTLRHQVTAPTGLQPVHRLSQQPPHMDSLAAENTQTQVQSCTQNTRYCVTNKKIFLGYPRYLGPVPLRNTGHAWQIDMPAQLAEHTLLSGPPLADREYRLAQLHCHWGEHCNQGSEHLINGKSYAAEIHLVHWNCTQFRSAEEASRHKHGLAVVAVLVEALDEGGQRNKHLDKIIAGLPQISEPNTGVTLEACRLDLKKLLPPNRWNYATYEGSLTTPPLSEVVDWIVFLEPIQCSRQQIEQFRRLKCSTGDQLMKNCRPVQAHHDRPVSIWTHSHAN